MITLSLLENENKKNANDIFLHEKALHAQATNTVEWISKIHTNVNTLITAYIWDLCVLRMKIVYELMNKRFAHVMNIHIRIYIVMSAARARDLSPDFFPATAHAM